MCRCGTMQNPSQLPARIQREMAGYQPRGFFQHGQQPPAYPPQQPQYAQQQERYTGMPPAPQPPNLDQMWNMPEIQARVNQVVEQALANYNPEYPAPVQGIAPEALYQLAQLTATEVPGDAPKNNSGGRLNAYNKGREEVVAYVKQTIGGLLEVVHEQQGLSAGERAITGGPEVDGQGAGQVQDVLHESNPTGF